MKSITCFIIIIFFANNTFAQLDTSFVNLTQNLIREYQKTGTIYYGDRIYNKEILEGHFHFILSNEFIKKFNLIPGGKTSFSCEERAYIVNQLKKSIPHQLNDSLFSDSKRIASDSIMKFLITLNRIKLDLFINTHDSIGFSNYFKNFSEHGYCSFFFTNPIYLKQKSVYFIYFMWLFYDGGEEGLYFFKKVNNKWIPWKSFGLGGF
jgi:hypothetical protein